MNQSILFPDIQNFDSENQLVIFSAQSQGALIECTVSVEYLGKLSDKALSGDDSVLNAFEQHRFDLEELAEDMIEDDLFSPDGRIEIK
ncbi:DUF1488 domain-containing protein [Vibrio viridaestus]|uniref:DUF1488 domain-containing protein n=1 Tax=Vibrio viridaestus TaxID=2487322 RepID=A0A3N9TAT7_9VIBR|nr:DUF1488 domain-containing protein [Vibrio viridaestus]RQW61297.1 DUF1488 domain-containing protein [Vibrio viridaestus]